MRGEELCYFLLRVCWATGESLAMAFWDLSLLKSPVFAASRMQSGMMMVPVCPRLLRCAWILSRLNLGVGSSLVLVSGVEM